MYVKISKNQFFAKRSYKHGIFAGFLAEYIENDDSHIQSKFEAHILSNI